MRDESLIVSNLLGTRDPETLTFLQCLHKQRCFNETVVRAHVEPSETATHLPDIELAALKIGSNEIGDLQFAPSGRLETGRDLNDLGIAKVETRDSPIRTRNLRLFLDRKGTACSLNSTIPYR